MDATQGELASQVGTSRQTINAIERTGRHDAVTVAKLAKHFGVSVSVMYEPDAETANMQFLAAQIDRLSDDAFDKLTRFSRALAQRTAIDSVRPKRR